WSFTFSAFAFLLNNKKGGIIWTLSFGIILFLMLSIQNLFGIKTAYSDYELFTFLSVFGMNSYLIYTFQQEVDLCNLKLTELNSSLKNKVLEEVDKNKKQDAILSTQAKQAQMGEMVSMIAHQWRQPLNAISASAIKMKLENELGLITSDTIDATSNFIQNKTQEMSEIINSFLDFSKPKNEDSKFLLSQAIDKTLKIINTHFGLYSILIEVSYETDFKESKIVGSENLFEQVLLNLLINIRDAFDENRDLIEKNIFISVDDIGNVSVIDNAGGIEPQILDKLFNPYFTTKEEGKGTGLALYMSRKIMREHFSGDLVYKDILNGSSFKIVFNKNLDEGLKDV
ncbi:MAG: HAMP domain-containing sensor histidine kinase, partial [Campylobacterota bacterium]|nr:HAMP domain-containing sensor histidine kinase [Campylobacterota bacterium]